MPLQKVESVTLTAKDETDPRTRVEFYRADADASPPNHARVKVSVPAEAPDGSVQMVTLDVKIADLSLTAQEKSGLAAVLPKIVNEVLALKGYAEA